jgi:hypothetical protein
VLDRKDVLKAQINVVLQPEFDMHAKLKVKFINEDAEDASGLTRKALRLAVSEIVTKSGIFKNGVLINKETCKKLNLKWNDLVFVYFVLLSKQNQFYYASGAIMRLAILHGAWDLNCFSSFMVEILLSEDLFLLEPCFEDIHEESFKTKFELIISCENGQIYDKLVDDDEIQCLLKIMNLSIAISLKNKLKIVSAMCRFLLIDSNLKSINDFKNGLNVHKFLNLKCSHIRSLFVYDNHKNLTATVVRELFTINVNKSIESAANFQKNLKSMKFFFDYLDEIESIFVSNLLCFY